MSSVRTDRLILALEHDIIWLGHSRQSGIWHRKEQVNSIIHLMLNLYCLQLAMVPVQKTEECNTPIWFIQDIVEIKIRVNDTVYISWFHMTFKEVNTLRFRKVKSDFLKYQIGHQNAKSAIKR